jgi:hypothetical protein
MTAKKSTTKPLPLILAQELNMHRRQLLGAASTVTPRFMHRSATQNLPANAIATLREFSDNAVTLSAELKKQAALIEDFYSKYGSDAVKLRLAKKREIQSRIDAGKMDEITDEEWKILFPPQRARKKKIAATTLAEAINNIAKPLPF